MSSTGEITGANEILWFFWLLPQSGLEGLRWLGRGRMIARSGVSCRKLERNGRRSWEGVQNQNNLEIKMSSMLVNTNG